MVTRSGNRPAVPDVGAASPPPATTAPRSAEPPLLTLTSVRKSYAGAEVLDVPELEIMPGEFFTLLGPSGCGKTTLLRIVGGFERPTAGDVRLRGESIVALPPERRPFNLVFQSYALFPHMSVAENVAYGPKAAGCRADETADRVATALELVGMESLAQRSVTTLSGGQQQRVALARAVVNRPEVLLLDEPLGALDLKLRRRLQRELRQIQQALGTTFVYVTHDQEEALTLSHRIAVMRAGEILQVGEPREVYEAPKSRFVAEFVGEPNVVPSTVRASGQLGTEVQLDGGGTVTLSCHADWTPRAGEPAFAVLRPEQLELCDVDGAAFRGTVTDVVFQGASVRCELAVPDGQRLSVQLEADGRAPTGSTVGVRVRPGRGVVVPAVD